MNLGIFALSQKSLESVTPPLYVAYCQAPIPARNCSPIGSAGLREHEGLWSEQPIPGIQPGMADHAPTGWVAAGAGPGAKHRIFATSGLGVLKAHSTADGVVRLPRHIAWSAPYEYNLDDRRELCSAYARGDG